MTSPHRTSEHVLSELIADAIRQYAGAVGVLVRDLLAHDANTLLHRLQEIHREEAFPELRIAYLLPGGTEAAQAVGVSDDLFSDEIEQAERWRNQRDLNALIVVVARGDEAKLSSLEDFWTVTSHDLKGDLVDRAMGGPAGENEVQARFWQMLADDDAVGLGQLVDYYLSLEGKDGTEFKNASSRELHRLGLLPDSSLFDHAHASAMVKRLRSNRELVERLQMLTPKDRRTIKQVVEAETRTEEKAILQEALDQLHRTRSVGETTCVIDYDHAERLVKARTRRPPPTNGKRKPPEREPAADIASDSLINPERHRDLDELLDNLRQTLEAADGTSVRTETIRTQFSDTPAESVTTVRLDVVNLVAKMLDDGVYGGLVQIDLDGINDLLRRFNVQEHVIGRWTRDDITKVLDEIAGASDGGRLIAEQFAIYDAARTAILPYVRALIVEPLVIAAHSEARTKLLAAVDAYKVLTDSLREHYDEVFDVVGSDVDELIGRLLLTDTVVIKGEQRLFALLSPLHPLFLWHYTSFADLVAAQRDRLDDRDKKLVTDSARRLPNFLTSLYVPPAAFGQGQSLAWAGRLSQLPYYSDVVEGSAGDDGIDAIVDLIKGYIALEPHSRLGLRIALVDPPDSGPYLSQIVALNEEASLEGAHVVVYRHHPDRLSVELRLDEDDEDRVAQVFQASNVARRFTFEVRDRPSDELGPADDEPFHVAVVFDRSSGRYTRAQTAAHPIQPLAVPRRIRYSAVHKTVELEPAPGGLFESYYKVVGRISEGGNQASYLAVHQQHELRQTLQALAQRVAWTAVADRQIDRDLDIGALRIFTAKDREREVAAFARTTTAFRRPLREVARRYNTFISDEELDELLRQLSNLLDSGLLNVKPDYTGMTNENRIKGLLGTLIAARWYRKNSSSETRLLISLDSPDARRWMHLSDDPLRADLVGFDWTNEHCTVNVIEVKSVEAAAGEYVVKNGIVSGSAVMQTLATRRLLSEILTAKRDDELITTPARREVLREHLYRELTKEAYTPEDRRLWADRLRRLLDGKVKTDVTCHIVDVRLGAHVSTLRDRSVVAEEGDRTIPIRVHQLNEEVIEELVEPTAPPGDDPGGGGPGKGPQAPTHHPPSVGDSDRPTETDPDSTELTSNDSTAPSSAARRAHRPLIAPEDTQLAPEPNRPRVLLGTAAGTYGKPHDVWFDPNLPGHNLPNPHISITGETGSGKTQATKTIVSELGALDLPALILDFKDDYSDEAFIDAESFRLYDASFESLPFNPLTPAVDKRQGLVNPSQHIYQVANIIKRIYKLGDQQAYRLREAIKRAYGVAGISLRPGPVSEVQSFPPFDDVHEQLLDDKANEPLLGRLSPIFDLGLFRNDQGRSTLDEFLHCSAVIRLGQLPSDEVKNSVAEFFLMALYNYLVRQPQTHTLGQLLVLDEAWRVVESPFLTPLMREGRAFGLGVVIASQFPRDFPEPVRGSTATRLFFSQSQVEQIREIQRAIVGKTSGPEAEHVASVVRGLTPLSCIMHSTQYAPFARVAIAPYFCRPKPIASD